MTWKEDMCIVQSSILRMYVSWMYFSYLFILFVIALSDAKVGRIHDMLPQKCLYKMTTTMMHHFHGQDQKGNE